MNMTQPIRNMEDLERFKDYYRSVNPNKRNYLFIVISLNTALRVSDVLDLRWEDVYDFPKGSLKKYISIIEQKTGKKSVIRMNKNIHKALDEYYSDMRKECRNIKPQDYLFSSGTKENHPISRVQAFRIVKKAANECHLEGVISCHSLRKTFGYHAWKQGIPPVLLMNIYNHSSFEVTSHYLGIEQDDRDNIFENILL